MPLPIALRALDYSYAQGRNAQPVFERFEHVFADRASIAILGRSGSGKSTLLHLLAGLDRPQRGAIEIDGQDLCRLSESRLTLFRRQRIGMVFQFFNLIATLSVGDNLLLPLELAGTPRGSRAARVTTLLEQVGLGGYAGRFPEELSGGEQQRVAVARSLVHSPQLVLADEPTGSLDAANGRRIIELLHEMTAEEGRRLLLVTHSREVASTAEQVLVLERGRLSDYHEGVAW